MLNRLLITILFSLVACLFAPVSFAKDWLIHDDATDFSQYPFYFGGMIGFGDTNWGGLVDPDAESDGSDVSTPVKATGTGVAWGVMGGFEFNRYFAIQGNYQHYPTSRIFLDSFNSYLPTGQIVESETKNYALVAKFMVPIFNSGFRLFSDVGPAYTLRNDELENMGHWAAQFGAGINYNITPRFLTEINFNYTTGFDESNTTPIDDYIPFLYSINFGLAYRFDI